MTTSVKQAQDILRDDIQTLIRDTEKLLTDTADIAGDQATELRGQIEERLLQARQTLESTHDTVRQRGEEVLCVADEYIREKPWQAVGIAAGVGLLIGLLANRR